MTTDMPTIVNLGQDPFERTPATRGESTNDGSGGYLNDFYAREFWRFVSVQKAVEKLAMTAIDYPPMQASASFNLSASSMIKIGFKWLLCKKNSDTFCPSLSIEM